ncbi:hypothetical protein D915_000483 [Fasciola hepatica]|uniref:Dynein light chain n=1 Tax=Fasciola hepatica TaxID=6192 RepID=A0A4E0RRJ5_FASHE|nr:hypothetical protein D915_000483 [Fasciola hepatica]
MMQKPRRIIYKTDMTAEMQEKAVELISHAFAVYVSDVDVVAYLTDEFDKRYEPSWHCIMGTQFTTSIKREEGCYIHFHVNNKDVVLFKW